MLEHSLHNSIETTIANLRASLFEGPIDADKHISEGVYFSWDGTNSDIVFDLQKPDGAIFNSNAIVPAAPRWFSFNIGLGTGVFSEGDTLTIILDHSAKHMEPIEFFVRTSSEGKEHDTLLAESVSVGEDRAISTAMHWVEHNDPMCAVSGFHTLIIPMPFRDFQWQLNNIKVLVSTAL